MDNELYPDRPGVEGLHNQSSCLNHALNRAAEMKAQQTADNKQKTLRIRSAPAQFKGEALPDPAKVAARKVVERSLQTAKYSEFQPSLMPELPDADGQTALF